MADRATTRALGAVILAVAFVAGACGGSSPDPVAGPTGTPPPAGVDDPTPPRPTVDPVEGPTPEVAPPRFVDENGFDDHTVPELANEGEFFALARSGANGLAVVKFSIPSLYGDHRIHWMDSGFYELHDEWYWFRLLNGQPVPNTDVQPVFGDTFDTVAEVYEWATENRNRLPLDLTFVDSKFTEEPRLYSPAFYDLVLHRRPRSYAVGSVIHVPGAGDERWLIELEFSDDPTPEEIAAVFERLAPTLPPAIGDRLELVVRSTNQERTAKEMLDDGLPYADRIVRWSDVIPAGQVGVYNPGIAAGRLLLVEEGGARLADAEETDIVLIENVPDILPPATALLTSAPQTPLAHVNLLARNRGIPNASLSGLLDNPGIAQAARVRAPAIVRAGTDGTLEIVLIDSSRYEEWQQLLRADRVAVEPVDVSELPLTLDLTALAETVVDDDDLAPLRPVIGGKAAGFLSMIAVDAPLPYRPTAITVRPYVEHLATVAPALDAVLAHPDFREHTWARYLLLEGYDDLATGFAGPDELVAADELIAANPPGTLIGDVIAAGGFKKYFRAAPMAAVTIDELTDELARTYAALDDSQGLRFRSSSSVEDIEGFNGAGLYDSNTGFLVPDGDDSTVEEALKKTWASYWGFEAFEERRRENIDHRSGAMAVLVHPRFDDDMERNNGVATFTFLPGGGAAIELNAQQGAVSVTNPDPDDPALPEIVTARRGTSGTWQVERVAASTLTTTVLDDDAIDALLGHLESVATRWRDQVNGPLPAGQQREVIVLDFEFKTMAPGWPAGSGVDASGGLVLKQARSLDPGLRDVPDDVRALAVPRDVLSRARLVQELVCRVDGAPSERATVVYTDPLLVPDMGYDEAPFVVGGAPVPSEEDCDRLVVSTLLSTPDQFLLSLLADDDRLDLVG